MPQHKVKTRFAPSPTGFIHVGSLRTALYNYLYAKQNKGEFLLRIEDTDRSRYIKGALEKTIEMLEWNGLQWNNAKPIVQSKRIDIYKKYADQLVEEKKAYYCFCASQRLEKMRNEQIKKKQPPRYDGLCRKLSKTEVEKNLKAGKKSVIRLKVPQNKTVEFQDVVYGKVQVQSKEIDDQVLIKSDGYPTYHLAVVIDDHEMNITHVLRGEDWLPSTPKHILLYQDLGWNLPTFCHLPNILGEGHKKLSKRRDDVSVEDFREKGYLSEALINYLALLGWNPGTEQEIFSLAELIKKFDIKKVHKAGATFDIKKLDNINGHCIRKLKADKLKELCLPYLMKAHGKKLQKYNSAYIKGVTAIEQERMKKLSEVVELTKFFFVDKLNYKKSLLIWKKIDKKDIKKYLTDIMQILNGIKKWDVKNIEKALFNYIKNNNLSNGEVLWPLRVALSGEKNSPGPFEIAGILGKKESITRIREAVHNLS